MMRMNLDPLDGILDSILDQGSKKDKSKEFALGCQRFILSYHSSIDHRLQSTIIIN